LEEIRAAYRRRARWLHPDVNHSRDAAVRFRRLHHAYTILRSPSARAAYDEQLRRWQAASRAAATKPVRDVYHVEPWFGEKTSSGERLEVWLMLLPVAVLLYFALTVAP
jgi:DnaJ-class molecular chaperone